MLIGTAQEFTGTLGIWTPGPWEIAIFLLALLLLFGGKKLPELARGLGRGLRTFKKELQGEETDKEEDKQGGSGGQETEVKQDQDQQPPDDTQQA